MNIPNSKILQVFFTQDRHGPFLVQPIPSAMLQEASSKNYAHTGWPWGPATSAVVHANSHKTTATCPPPLKNTPLIFNATVRHLSFYIKVKTKNLFNCPWYESAYSFIHVFWVPHPTRYITLFHCFMTARLRFLYELLRGERYDAPWPCWSVLEGRAPRRCLETNRVIYSVQEKKAVCAR